MTTCVLSNEKAKSGKFKRLTLNDTGIVEALANDILFKHAKVKAYPLNVIGANGIGYMGRLLLEQLSLGWTVHQDADDLSKDRLLLSSTMEDERRIRAYIDLLVPAKDHQRLRAGGQVFTNHLLFSSSQVLGKTLITACYVSSMLTPEQATHLSVAARLSEDPATLANFLGDHANPKDAFKQLRNYDLLGDEWIDRLDGIGVAVRSVDFRQLASSSAASAFVGF